MASSSKPWDPPGPEWERAEDFIRVHGLRWGVLGNLDKHGGAEVRHLHSRYRRGLLCWYVRVPDQAQFQRWLAAHRERCRVQAEGKVAAEARRRLGGGKL